MKKTLSMLPSLRCCTVKESIQKLCIISLTILVTMNCLTRVEAYGTKTVIVGLNAAFQKRFILSPDTSLEPGSVHRAASLEEGIGGKGQDVAIALSCLSSAENSGVLLAQFLGKGAEGDQVLSMMSQRCKGSGNDLTVRTQAKLRTCTTIVASDVATELVEPSGTISSDEIQDLLDRISSVSKTQGLEIGGLCVMGSMPPGCQDDMYASIHSFLFPLDVDTEQQPLCLVDSVVGLKPLLHQMSSYRRSPSNQGGKRRGGMFKVNIAELCKLANIVKTSGGEANCATKEEIVSAVEGFVQTYDAADALEYIAITDGKFPAHLVKLVDNNANDESKSFRLWQLKIASLADFISQRDGTDQSPTLLYPIGAGDTVAAGTLAAWQYLSLPEEHKKDFTQLNPSVQQSLNNWKNGDHAKNLVEEKKDLAAVTAFAFGLACGSASCIQQENSVLETQDALSLLEQMTPPTIVS